MDSLSKKLSMELPSVAEYNNAGNLARRGEKLDTSASLIAPHRKSAFGRMLKTMITHVYFISIGISPVKIGVSDKPKARLATLQTAHYERLKILFTIPCDSRENAFELEALLHRWYIPFQLKNEWFSINEDILCRDLDTFRRILRASLVISCDYSTNPLVDVVPGAIWIQSRD